MTIPSSAPATRPPGWKLMLAYSIALAAATIPLAVIWVFDLGEIPRLYSLTLGGLALILLAWNVALTFTRRRAGRRVS